ncbi:hypothetical protein SAMN05661091_4098 [Paenibacillus uliginis N3/975]|uniref:RecT family protein n=1 Tax=Paenibacillus uliginis N3/975 TaxID=1313296 RepID=A0A1X7HK59_9BACL|nr:hypothetical protein [Paenibacillus uliginis]SMF88073.1 hypothetical protein SAMN05661091_4098 [Paenibacillus uliginis N3/975]
MSNQTYSTGLTKVNDTFLPMIESQLVNNGINMDQYSKQCVMNALSSINAALDTKGLSFNDSQLDKNNVTTTLLNVAALKLNAAASPREVYFQIRNVKVKVDGKDVWKKQIEMGIEGDGNDAILSNFGRNVDQVRPFWLVREGDEFEYPSFNGLEMTPPKWTPKGKGDVVRVVYPIIFKDQSIQYFISERDDVAKNLVAHIQNNMMNETFGVLPAGKTRYDANADQLKKIAEKKTVLLKKASELGLKALDDDELQKWISPAWSEYHSREAMIIRKMRNNLVKKIPKDFGSAFVELIHDQASDGDYAAVREEITERANREPIDIKPETPTEPQWKPQDEPAPDQPKQEQKMETPPPASNKPEKNNVPADDDF